MLASIETDKAVVDFEMQEEGFVAKILYPAGSKDVPLGSVIAVLVEKKDNIPAFSSYTGKANASAEPVSSTNEGQTVESSDNKSVAQVAPTNAGDRIFVSPLAKKQALNAGASLNLIAGTGPNGRIISADVTEFLSKQSKVAATQAVEPKAAP